MPVIKMDDVGDAENWRDWHILTVAESGFSMLMGYACDGLHNLDCALVANFSEQINYRNESGSLHPAAPISALPNRYFRDIPDNDIPNHIDDFMIELKLFISANRENIHARNLMIDFHVSPDEISPHYVNATTEIFNDAMHDGEFDKVVVITGVSGE